MSYPSVSEHKPDLLYIEDALDALQGEDISSNISLFRFAWIRNQNILISVRKKSAYALPFLYLTL